MRSVAYCLRSIFISIPSIALATVLASTVACIAAWLRSGSERDRAIDRCKRAWARAVLRASFVSATMTGLENIPSEPHLICANHLSYLDPPVLIATLPGSVTFVAKKSLFLIPFLGWAMRLDGDLMIDRDNAGPAPSFLSDAARRARDGRVFVIFPEGSRSRTG